MAIQEYVYIGKDNTNILEIKQNGTLVDFSAGTRFVLELTSPTNSETVDTDIDPGSIIGDSFGVLTFDLGNILATPQCYSSTLTVYDPAHPNGQIIFTNDCSDSTSQIYFVVC